MLVIIPGLKPVILTTGNSFGDVMKNTVGKQTSMHTIRFSLSLYVIAPPFSCIGNQTRNPDHLIDDMGQWKTPKSFLINSWEASAC